MSDTQSTRRPPVTPAEYAERNASPGSANRGDGSGFFGAAQDSFDAAKEGIKDNARSVAEEQKSAGAARLDAFGRAVHGAAEALGKEIPQAAAYIHSAADDLQSVSAKLRQRTVDDLASRVGQFARKQPAAAFAASVLAGIALSRFLKSSSK